MQNTSHSHVSEGPIKLLTLLPVEGIDDGIKRHAVRGLSERGGYGVIGRSVGYGYSNSYFGVRGGSLDYIGVSGASDTGTGVDGISLSGYGVYGGSNSGYGVIGFSNSGYGVIGFTHSGYAAYLGGNVVITGNLQKGGGSFKIDHPLDPGHKYLHHSFVESPDMKNVYDGMVALDNKGEAEIELPAGSVLLSFLRTMLSCYSSHYMRSRTASVLLLL